MKIKIWNRIKKSESLEKVYGELPIHLLYNNPIGQFLTEKFFANHWFSKCYGAYQDSSLSKKKISSFIRKFSINMEDYEKKEFRSFNDFFIRKFRDKARAFTAIPSQMPAFCEGRYTAYTELERNQLLPIKGVHLPLEHLILRKKWVDLFSGGPCLIARLCPTDYHRFHYPDDGTLLEQYTLQGKLHSVNPVALKARTNTLFTNERQVSVLKTKNFGNMAYIEVGALCVGKIVQSNAHECFHRGEEKGYFLFGGSTVILVGEPGKWRPAPDLVEQTKQKRECFVQLGERIGQAGP